VKLDVFIFLQNRSVSLAYIFIIVIHMNISCYFGTHWIEI